MDKIIREQGLIGLIEQYNLYCKNNPKMFLAGNINQEIIDFSKDGYHTQKFYSDEFIWGFAFADLSHLDLSKVPAESLMRIPFSTHTKWPDASKLPIGFDPQELLRSKERISLGLSKTQLTGQGVKVAYIDSPIDIDHEAFKGKHLTYASLPENREVHFHGYAVADKLLKTAPEVELTYYGCSDENGLRNQTLQKITALEEIAKLVNSGKNIVAVGMSCSLEENIVRLNEPKLMKRLHEIQTKLAEMGVEYIDSNRFFQHFNYAYNIDSTQTGIDNFAAHYIEDGKKRATVIDAEGVRPLPYTIDGYMYENAMGSASWAIPKIVGLFCLAKEKNPKISFEEFAEICLETSHENANGVNIINVESLTKQLDNMLKQQNNNILTNL